MYCGMVFSTFCHAVILYMLPTYKPFYYELGMRLHVDTHIHTYTHTAAMSYMCYREVGIYSNINQDNIFFKEKGAALGGMHTHS